MSDIPEPDPGTRFLLTVKKGDRVVRLEESALGYLVASIFLAGVGVTLLAMRAILKSPAYELPAIIAFILARACFVYCERFEKKALGEEPAGRSPGCRLVLDVVLLGISLWMLKVEWLRVPGWIGVILNGSDLLVFLFDLLGGGFSTRQQAQNQADLLVPPRITDEERDRGSKSGFVLLLLGVGATVGWLVYLLVRGV